MLEFYVCMELMHDFVRGCMYSTSAMYIFSRGTGYFVGDARVGGSTKHHEPNTPRKPHRMASENGQPQCNHTSPHSRFTSPPPW